MIRRYLREHLPLAGLLALFAGSQAESFVRYFVIVIFAGIVWPLTFPFFAKIGEKGKAA